MTVKCFKDTEHENINREIEDNILRLLGNINVVKDESRLVDEDDELDMNMQSILLDALNESYTGDYIEDANVEKEVVDSKIAMEDSLSDRVIKNIKLEQELINEKSDILKAEFLVKYKNIENDFIKASELYDKVDYKNIDSESTEKSETLENVNNDIIDILDTKVVYKNIVNEDNDKEKHIDTNKNVLKVDASNDKCANVDNKEVENANNVNQNDIEKEIHNADMNNSDSLDISKEEVKKEINAKVSFLLDNIKPEVIKELEEDVKRECAYENVDNVTRVDEEDLSKEELHKQILEDIKQSRIRIKEQKMREEELKAKAMECINSMKLEETNSKSIEKELNDIVIENLNDKKNYEKFYKMIKGLRVNAPNKKVMGIVAGMLAIMVVVMMLVTGAVTASSFK